MGASSDSVEWAPVLPPLHTEDLTPELLLQFEVSVKRLDLVANTVSTVEEDKVKIASEVGRVMGIGGDGRKLVNSMEIPESPPNLSLIRKEIKLTSCL